MPKCTRYNIAVVSSYVLIHVVLWDWLVWVLGYVMYYAISMVMALPFPPILGAIRTDCGGDHTCGFMKLLFTLYHADSQLGERLRELCYSTTCLGVFVGALVTFLIMLCTPTDDPEPDRECEDKDGKLVPWNILKLSVMCQLLVALIWGTIIQAMHISAYMSGNNSLKPEYLGVDGCCNLLRPMQ